MSNGKSQEEVYYASKEKIIAEIEFENFIREREEHERMLDEAAEWLDEEINFMNDQEDIVLKSLIILKESNS